jgi:hypothetical protein
MAEQPRLDVLGPERLAQERVVQQVDLTYRQEVGGAPPPVQQVALLSGQRALARVGLQ